MVTLNNTPYVTSSFLYAVLLLVVSSGYAPDECGCCSSAVNSSFIRTMTTSFGSICFGSFLVAVIQALRALANSAQQNGDAQIFACIAECILSCLASLLEYFNKVWKNPMKKLIWTLKCVLLLFKESERQETKLTDPKPFPPFPCCYFRLVGFHLCWIVRYAVFKSW
jgi:hypothetical protein